MNEMDLKLTGILLGIFGLISIAAMVLTIADKVRAKNHEWRVPENTLLLVAAFGGAAAMLLTMLIIRHKTQHRKFMGGLPILIFYQIILVLWCNFRFGLF